ncbi:MAG: hypothetical protein R6X02_32540 [Enhygromyxa sp.]
MLRRSVTLALLAATTLALACATSGETLSGEPATPVEAEAEPKQADAWAVRTLTDLERRLQAAARVEIAFVIESEGAVVSQLEGKLVWERDAALAWTVSGEFNGEPQQLELRGDAQTLEVLGAGESRWTGPRPPALIEAVVVGLTRQGLLHNLAMLVAGRPPDHADGGVAEWIQVIEPQLGPPEVFGTGEARPLEFQITVSKRPVGRATLWLDERGLPIERRQVVNFGHEGGVKDAPEGQLRVTERFTSFVVVD